MVKKVTNIQVKDTSIRTMQQNGIDYVCITDIARQKNAEEPKDVVKNWMRLKNTIEYMGLWEKLNNPQFKGVGFDSLYQEAWPWAPSASASSSGTKPTRPCRESATPSTSGWPRRFSRCSNRGGIIIFFLKSC